MRWRKRTKFSGSKYDRWFAWYPVHVGWGEFAWLERVHRTRKYIDGSLYYTDYGIITRRL